jgi:SAM-dependent methyltransferase
MKHSPERLKKLRNVLLSADFTPEGVLKTIGVTDSASIKESDILLLMHRTQGGTPLETLIRLFLMEMPVDSIFLATAIEPMGLVEWEEMGLISVHGGSAKAEIKLFPYQDLMIAYDLPRRLLSEDGYDFVMGIGGSSITLANLTIRREAKLALDLGAGCGFQAFLAARHCDRVIAVDRNPRAVALAGFNARLNGIHTLECREGDLFAPVEGMTFDLIVSNPPFVISPESRYIYRDSPMAGDDVCRRIIREAPRFLNEGGFCQILCNWAELADQDWRERLRGWFDGCGCDVWIMRNQSRDVANYAANWIRHTEKLETEHMEERFSEWLTYYEKQRIVRISGGVINMRRRSGCRNWFHVDDGVETMFGPGGEYILKGFVARDFLEGVGDDAALLMTAFVLSPDVRIVQQLSPSEGKWVREVCELHLSRGLSQKGEIDPYVETLLIGCDGAKPLGTLIREMAETLGVPVSDIESAVCAFARDFIIRGFLHPPARENTQEVTGRKRVDC